MGKYPHPRPLCRARQDWARYSGISSQMPVRDLDIWRAAKQLLEDYQEAARREAIKRVADAREVGDKGTEAVWVRIAQAVTELQKKQPDNDPLN